MALLRFFKLPKHQKYEYKPRFWDPQKEEMEERLKRIEEMKSGGAKAAKARISGGFRRTYNADTKTRKQQVMRSNLVLIGIIVVLLLLSYLFLTVYLPEIVNAVESGD